MKSIWFKAVPFDKAQVTLALESGVDGLIVEAGHVDSVKQLGRVDVLALEDVERVTLADKGDEETATASLKAGRRVVLAEGWEIIPVENILAQAEGLGLEAASLDRARLAAGILERGVDWIVVTPEGTGDLKAIVAQVKLAQHPVDLATAKVTAIAAAGLGHRVCVDTMSVLKKGQGMLVGNSSAFTFLVHAETESNPYVAARPFRVNAGAVHAYAQMPGDRTAYLEELGSGREVLIVSADGAATLATVGRIKTEVRPMLSITAKVGDAEGTIFLQNAETIRLTRPGGEPVSVVSLKVGDEILCKVDQAGRHFGMRICEDIKEC
ncbi:3-dehydroquinate synthase II family protein [Fundidesulfovibrio butyratiphilus]